MRQRCCSIGHNAGDYCYILKDSYEIGPNVDGQVNLYDLCEYNQLVQMDGYSGNIYYKCADYRDSVCVPQTSTALFIGRIQYIHLVHNNFYLLLYIFFSYLNSY